MNSGATALRGLGTAEARHILQRAATLQERRAALGPQFSAPVTLSPTESYRHKDWEVMVSMGLDAAVLDSVYGGPQQRRALFSQAAIDAIEPDSAQISALVRLFDEMVVCGLPHPCPRPDAGPPPFEELFYGPVASALSALKARVARQRVGDRVVLADAVWDDLGQQLLLRLSQLATESLYRQFSVWRRRSMPDADAYALFIDTQRDPVLRAVFDDFPVLARLVLLALRQWEQACAEMLLRLAADQTAIAMTFGQRPCVLLRVLRLGSDPHNDGRTGCRLIFEGGFQLAYKPRSLAMEYGWHSLIAWLAERGTELLPKAAGALDRETYGWMEWLEADVDATTDEAFAATLGSLLCLAHLLDATDLHFENLLATRQGVAAVDLETLFHPRGPLHGEEALLAGGFSTSSDVIRHTVMWTHLLPTWVTIRNRDDIGMGGINASDALMRPTPTLVDVNTARMRLEMVPRQEATRSNLPRSLQDPARLAVLAPVVIRHFNQTWQMLDSLRAADGGLSAHVSGLFRQARTRVILRPTQVYFLILRRALSSEKLVDGAAWSSQFDFLLRFVDPTRLSEAHRTVLKAEAAALTRLDIPFFQCEVSARSLGCDSGLTCDAAYAQSPLDEVTSRLNAMDPADRHRQTMLIDASLAATEPPAQRPLAPAHPAPVPEQAASPLREPDFVEAAVDIGRALIEASVDGSGTSWLSLVPSRGYRFLQLELTRPDLYSGQLGIAVFLSALYRVTGDAIWLTATRRATARVDHALEIPALTKRTLLVHGKGLGSGLGGWVYSYLWLHTMTSDPADLDRAMRAARVLAAADCDEQATDILDGAAGAIVALLQLDARTGQPWLRDAACRHGDWLLSAAKPRPDGALVWPSLRDEALAGMAHGNAGIALALGLLADRTGQKRFKDAARRALRFERDMFDAARGGWPDLREGAPGGTPESPPMLNRWCHGATGIGLSRLRLQEVLDDPEIATEINLAIAATLPCLHDALDGLCCGTFGRIELLHVAGERLMRPDRVALARAAAARRVTDRRMAGRYLWPGGDDSLNAGLFTGSSGIGLGLLRLARPDVVPSLLQWR